MEIIFAHVSIVVTDLCRSTDFYCHVLGAKVEGIFEAPGSPLKRITLRVGGQILELMQYIDERAGQQRTAGVVDHLAFYVADLDESIASLRKAGVRCIDEAPRLAGNDRIFFFSGPDGERIEFVETPQEALLK